MESVVGGFMDVERKFMGPLNLMPLTSQAVRLATA